MKALVLVVCFFLLSEMAEATEIVRPDGGDVTWYEAQIAQAHVPGPRTTIVLTISSDECEEKVSCATAGPPPQVFLDPAQASRHDWLHEVGHVFDYTTLREGDRNYFRRVIGDARPWRSSPNSPHEKFAEAYSWCALSKRTNPVGAFGYHPTHGQHHRICRMIRKAGD